MIDYRLATPVDGPVLDSVARRIWLDTFGHSASADDIALYLAEAYGANGRLITNLANPAHRFQLALDAGQIAGFAQLSPVWLDDPAIVAGAMQLSQLYVDRPWHGTGVPQALMRWTMNTARGLGATALVLTVWEENHRAKAFYDRQGFIHIADYAFPTGNQVDRDLIMQVML
ncbi:MAG: GNAT family N-acetyltransferase [Sphingomonas hengshuiensis]|nr:MAG: GNAT family N-acetyltransferase [Sphingomonas hengshuiensis]